MTTRACLCCGLPTGRDVCLTCRGVLPRKCLECRTPMPQAADDYVCITCAEELGPLHRAEVQARRAHLRTLRRCEDCGLPMSDTSEPICGYCQWQRQASDPAG
jgi:hypothetical protein